MKRISREGGRQTIPGGKFYKATYILFLGLIILCSSCAQHNDYDLPLKEDVPFSVSGTSHFPDRWWTVLEDKQLNNHIEAGLDNNFSLAAAWERLQASQALATKNASALYPDLIVGFGADRTMDEEANTNEFRAALSASYEVDLWGRIRDSAEAGNLRALAGKENYHSAALTLSGEISITWYRLIEANMQLDLLYRQIDTSEKALRVLQARFGAGQVRSEDILRQKLLVESIDEEVIITQLQIETLEHQLAILRGQVPQGFHYTAGKSLPGIPSLPETGLPSELLQRRPDIRAAFFEIEAADKDLAAAVKDQYPRISLTASYGSESSAVEDLFSNWITNLAANLAAPLFDGKERLAEVDQKQAVRDELINLYAQSVLEAFREVEDALIREQKQQQRLANLQARLELARETLEQIELGYLNGAGEFLSVLSAQVQFQDTERNLLRAQKDLLEFRISLYRALAGGFTTPRELREKKD